MTKQQLIDKINDLKAEDKCYIQINREIIKQIKQLKLDRQHNLAMRRDIEKEIKHCAYLIKSGNTGD